MQTETIRRLYQVPIEETREQQLSKKISKICINTINEVLHMCEETGEDPYEMIEWVSDALITLSDLYDLDDGIDIN